MEVLTDVLLTIFCYAYILAGISISSQIQEHLHISQRVSRKFLHMIIGNLPFVIPFFALKILPVIIAAPFVLVTFLASPVCPFKSLNLKLHGLASITEEGHHWGLVFYAISYTFLALFFASEPMIIAAGILPMAYGDSVAAIVGEKLGRRKYKLPGVKSLEGSIAMFSATFLSLAIGFVFFSLFHAFTISRVLLSALAVALITTLTECVSPKGFDNLTVPFAGALSFLLLNGGAG